MNNNILSIELNNDDDEYHHHKEENKEEIILMLKENNMLDNYNFNNLEIYIDWIINKFSEENKEDIILDINNLNEEDIFKLEYLNGIIIVNFSNYINNINLLNNLCKIYDKVILNKVYDNYIIYFKDKLQYPLNDDTNLEKTKIYKKKDFTNKLNNIFIEDIKKINLNLKIKNIMNIIDNKEFNNKIKNDIEFVDNFNKNLYNYYYSNIKSKVKKYDNLLYDIILNNNIKYIFNNNLFNSSGGSNNSDKDNHQKLINNFNHKITKLKLFNNYINNISSKINTNIINNSSNLEQKNDNKKDNLFEISFLHEEKKSNIKININDLFNIHDLENLYVLINKKNDINDINDNNLYLTMNNALDENIYIFNNLKDLLNENIFYNNILIFLNHLIKMKIKKIIKIYNYNFIIP